MCGSADVEKFNAHLYLGYYGGYCRIGDVKYEQGKPETKEPFLEKLRELTTIDLQELIVGFLDEAHRRIDIFYHLTSN